MAEQPDNASRTPRGLTNRVPILHLETTVAEAYRYLTDNINHFETIDYIYLIDTADRLIDVLSIKDLFRSPPGTAVGQIHGAPSLLSATVETDPEEIAYMALDRGIKAVPLVDDNRRLVGVIPHDSITDILHRELREDTLRMAGVHHGNTHVDNVMEISLLKSLKHRLPWLLLGTLGGLFIAQIIGRFEATLRDNIILAAFIPLVVYIAAAVGTQLEVFAIRDFALFRKLDFGRYFRRQFSVVLGLAMALGLAAGAIGWLFYQRGDIALILGLAVGAATISSVLSGLLVPFLFRLVGTDPANASGPLGTIIQDTISVSVYLMIAATVL